MSSKLNDPVQKEYKARLKACLAKPENKYCVDCGAPSPTWASTNLGLFICMRCSGIHRHIGTHITKVKSTDLDAWQLYMVEKVEAVGNANAKLIYEHEVPKKFPRDFTDQYQLEQWIRAKYEHKKFLNPDFDEDGSRIYSSNHVIAPPSEKKDTVPVQQTQQPVQKQTPLIDFGDFVGANTPSQPSTQQSTNGNMQSMTVQTPQQPPKTSIQDLKGLLHNNTQMNGFGTQTGNYNMNGYSTSGQYTNGLYMNGQTGQYNMYQSTTLQYTNGQYSNGQYVQSTGMYTTNNQYMNGQNTQPQYGMYTTCSNQPTTPNVFSNTANLLSNKTHQTQPMQGTTTYTSSSSSSFQFPF